MPLFNLKNVVEKTTANNEWTMECPKCSWVGKESECVGESCPACGIDLTRDNRKTYTCWKGNIIAEEYCPEQISCMDSNGGGTCP